MPPTPAPGPPEPRTEALARGIGISVDVVALACLTWLIHTGKITPSEGLPWFALLLAARIRPRKGGGAASLLAWLLPR